MGKRNEIDICVAILRVARNCVRKSHLVYQTNLNFEVIKRYLKCLYSAGLIAVPSNTRRYYETTTRGIKFLHQYDNLMKYLSQGG